MPSHTFFDSQTRRSFLASATTGAASLAIPLSNSLAAKRKLSAVSFAVVSDTHLGHRDRPAAAGQWAKTAAEIAKTSSEFVLHLGDIVDRGREPQYKIYLETRKTIGKSVYEIPGNHDPQGEFETPASAILDG